MFPGFNANQLAIKLRAQRGMAFLILSLFRTLSAKILLPFLSICIKMLYKNVSYLFFFKLFF